MHMTQTEYLAIRVAQVTKISKVISTNAAPKAHARLSGTPKIQHGGISSSNSQIKAENRDATLHFLQHHYCLSQDIDTIPEKNLTK